MNTLLLTLVTHQWSAFLVFLGGFAIRYFIKMRRFYRTNSYGVQEFSNFFCRFFVGGVEFILWYFSYFVMCYGLLSFIC